MWCSWHEHYVCQSNVDACVLLSVCPHPPKTHAHSHTYSTDTPHPTSGVKCYSLLVVTVANHLSFCSNCFQGNREIWLPGTKSSTCDCYLFNSIFIYLFILKASTHIHTHTTHAHACVCTHRHTLFLLILISHPYVHTLFVFIFYFFCTHVHINTHVHTNTSLPLIN